MSTPSLMAHPITHDVLYTSTPHDTHNTTGLEYTNVNNIFWCITVLIHVLRKGCDNKMGHSSCILNQGFATDTLSTVEKYTTKKKYVNDV